MTRPQSRPTACFDDDRAGEERGGARPPHDLGHVCSRRIVSVESSGAPRLANATRRRNVDRARNVCLPRTGPRATDRHHRPVVLELDDPQRSTSRSCCTSSATAANSCIGLAPARDERRDAPQRSLFLGEHRSRLSRLGVRDRRRDELRERSEARLGVRRQRPFGRGSRHDAPEMAFDDDRASNRRLACPPPARRRRSGRWQPRSRRYERTGPSGAPSTRRSCPRSATALPVGKAASVVLHEATVVTLPSGSKRPIVALPTGNRRPTSSATASKRS